MKDKYAANNVLIVIPAYNEEATIGALLQEILALHSGYSILVVNDHSADSTPEVVRRINGVLIVDLSRNMGIGGAVQTGFIYASRNHYDYVVQLDADGQHQPADIGRLLDPLMNNETDVVIGSRFCNGKSSYRAGIARRTGIRIIAFFCWLLTGKKIKDCTSGFRAYNREAIQFLSEYYPIDYPEPEAVIMLIKNRFRVGEIPVCMHPRKAGKSSISFRRGTTYYMFKVVLGMIMTAIRPKTRKYGKLQ
jgi:glycosyltransferase involved in cell wall biosynthesis